MRLNWSCLLVAVVHSQCGAADFEIETLLEATEHDATVIAAPAQRIRVLLDIADVYQRCEATTKRDASLKRAQADLRSAAVDDAAVARLGMMAVLQRFAAAGSVADANAMLAEIDDPADRDSFRTSFAGLLVEQHHADAAAALIPALIDRANREHTWGLLAAEYAEQKQLESARRALNQITDHAILDQGRFMVVEALCKVSVLPEADGFIQSISHPRLKLGSLYRLASAHLKRGEREAAEKLTDALEALDGQSDRVLTLRGALGDFDLALRRLQDSDSQAGNQGSVDDLARLLIDAGKLNDGSTAVSTLKDPFVRSDTQRYLSKRQAADGHLAEAHQTALGISEQGIRCDALVGVARQQIRKGAQQDALISINEALVAVRDLEPGGATELILLRECGQAQIEAGDLDGARQTFIEYQTGTEIYEGTEYRAQLLQELYRAMSRDGMVDEARASALAQDAGITRAYCIVGVCNGLLDAKDAAE